MLHVLVEHLQIVAESVLEGGEARVLFGKQIYAQGQHCDETGNGRSSIVYYRCNPMMTRMEESKIEVIEEPNICQYRIFVGTPLLCKNYYSPAALHRRRLEVLEKGKVSCKMQSENITCMNSSCSIIGYRSIYIDAMTCWLRI